MFEQIKEWYNERKRRSAEKKREYNRQQVMQKSTEVYQICEYMDELWLTYDDNLVCPCSMLKDQPIEALRQLRLYYVTRNGVVDFEISDADFEDNKQ